MLDAILSSTCEQADRRVGELQPKKKRKDSIQIFFHCNMFYISLVGVTKLQFEVRM